MLTRLWLAKGRSVSKEGKVGKLCSTPRETPSRKSQGSSYRRFGETVFTALSQRARVTRPVLGVEVLPSVRTGALLTPKHTR